MNTRRSGQNDVIGTEKRLGASAAVALDGVVAVEVEVEVQNEQRHRFVTAVV